MSERKIDLQQFCSTERRRAYIARPWTRGGFTFATNGHVLIRLPAQADVPAFKQAPKTDRIFALQPEGPYIPAPAVRFPKFDPKPCRFCKGLGHEPGFDDEECEGCGGSGKTLESRSAQLGGLVFNLGYLRTLWALPKLELGPETADHDPWFFRFDGGDGALMPMRGVQHDHRNLRIQLPAHSPAPSISRGRG